MATKGRQDAIKKKLEKKRKERDGKK